MNLTDGHLFLIGHGSGIIEFVLDVGQKNDVYEWEMLADCNETLRLLYMGVGL